MNNNSSIFIQELMSNKQTADLSLTEIEFDVLQLSVEWCTLQEGGFQYKKEALFQELRQLIASTTDVSPSYKVNPEGWYDLNIFIKGDKA